MPTVMTGLVGGKVNRGSKNFQMGKEGRERFKVNSRMALRMSWEQLDKNR